MLGGVLSFPKHIVDNSCNLSNRSTEKESYIHISLLKSCRRKLVPNSLRELSTNWRKRSTIWKVTLHLIFFLNLFYECQVDIIFLFLLADSCRYQSIHFKTIFTFPAFELLARLYTQKMLTTAQHNMACPADACYRCSSFSFLSFVQTFTCSRHV